MHFSQAKKAPAGGVVVIAIIYLLYRYRNRAVGNQKPLSPLYRGRYFYPVIGQLLAVLRNYKRFNDFTYENTLTAIANLPKDAPKTLQISIPFQPLLVFTWSPENIEYALKKNFANYIKGNEFHRNMHELLGDGIFVVDGDQWKSQRKEASNIFSVGNFRDFTAKVFNCESAHLVSLLTSKGQTPFDLQDILYRFTLDSFAKIAFSVDLGCLQSSEPVPFAVAFDRSQAMIDERFNFPAPGLFHLLTGRSRTFKRDIVVIREFAAGTFCV